MPNAHRVLGVLVPPRYRAVAAEMFELFKTSWEPVRDDVEYEVILGHSESVRGTGRRLTIVTGGPGEIDTSWAVPPAPLRPPARIDALGIDVDLQHPWLPVGAQGEAFVWRGPGRLRLGYDLFAEIEALLTTGQPSATALNATTGRHLEIVRQGMLAAGIPIVEVDAAPAGAAITVALTHDVDFARLRNHVFDRTAAGFLYRATVATLIDFLRGRATLRTVGRNLAAAVKLPLVYLDWARDPWSCFARYAALEQRWRSTFFIIPQRDDPGRSAPYGGVDAQRACRYQASEVSQDLNQLAKAGFEIGLHGLDAWNDATAATTERSAIQEASKVNASGVRMHWLYFTPQTWAVLESAGFDYDSTFGFNDAIGFRGGTGQAFRPLGVEQLIELPLIIQDTALFLARRRHLDEEDAFLLCRRVIAEARTFGCGLAVLWHLRSLAPERCWDGFYTRLLAHLDGEGAWMAPAGEVVSFYRQRRSVRLDASVADGIVTVRPEAAGEIDARLRLRARLADGTQTVLRLPLAQASFALAAPE
jgi:hypothetical protein